MGKILASKNKLKIVAATSVAIFSLFSVCTGVFAWFLSAREKSSSSQDFKVTKVDTAITSIEIYKYLGEEVITDGDEVVERNFGFSPSPYSVLSISNGEARVTTGSSSIALDHYSIDDAHHPCLILFKVEGAYTTISAKTEYPYIPIAKPSTNGTYATKAALKAASGSLVANNIYEVTHDESQSGRYSYVENEVTKYDYVNTCYKYHGDDVFELVWTNLAMYDNALSSAVMFHWFKYATKPAASTHDLYEYSLDGDIMVRDTTVTADVSCITVDATKCDSTYTSNMYSFVDMTNPDNPTMNDESNMFDGYLRETVNETLVQTNYIGIVVDYYPEALEYLFSYYLGHDYLNGGLSFKCDWTTYL